MSKLIVKPVSPNKDGIVLAVSPESAGWQYVGFEVAKLEVGQKLERVTGDLEYCLVLLSGIADVATQEESFTKVGDRMSVFENKPPYAVYVPNGDRFEVTATTALELAICSAPGKGGFKARLIAPSAAAQETRGYGNLERQIYNILPESEPADSLLVVEVITPEGHWSSYPPHKHDRDALPEESLLEETYYYKIQPEQGFAVQRVYTDNRSLDETLIVKNGETVLVPEGYHPVSAPPGYEVYYLNVMAGPTRAWKFVNDEEHAWIMTKPSDRV
ncbi:5-deoxy-glucuronate isomerase [Paenibacillus sp. FSL H8-0548]|uniref:5-deoxy-glucuronate isomerase n=1 Tax=Paenibacillus sp. FSL H8-0548 TaxID=1920422 RepID=UPI00096C8F1A|nr:5-deoxy-glucuronate isomerase [Paenibacillus sp. FSL H8-0548]OMF26713.1 5-deoxy-glucuronate isomerase [Paenibacillus sp. FSL H8-0548]